MRRFGSLVLLLAFAIAVAAGSAHFTRLSRHSLEAYQNAAFSSAATVAAQTAETDAARLTERVLVLVLSGLRDDTSWRFASLQYIAERGLAVPVDAAVPTHGPANWLAMFSGASPAALGLILPAAADPDAHAALPVAATADTVLRRAVAAGITVEVVGSGPFRRLVAPPGAITRPLPEGIDAALTGIAEHWYTDEPGLLVAQIDVLDTAGHGAAPNSRDYLQRAGELDAALIRFLRGFNLNEATLIIVGDHGQLADGRHGGSEPDAVRTAWIMSGPGIDRDWRPEPDTAMPQTALASVVSGLLGLPLPERATTAAGQQLLALDDAGAVADQAARERWHTANANIARWLTYTQATTPTRGESATADAAPVSTDLPAVSVQVPATISDGTAEHSRLLSALDDALAVKTKAETIRRLPWTAGAALILLTVLIVVLLGAARSLVLTALAIYVFTSAVLWLGPWEFGPFYAPHSGSASWSSLPAHTAWAGYFRQRIAEAVAVLLPTAVLSGWLTARQRSSEARRSKRVQTPTPAALGLQFAVVAAALLGLVWLALFTIIGEQYDLNLPSLELWHALQLLGIHLQIVGYGAVGWAAAAAFGGAFHLRHVPDQSRYERPVIVTRPAAGNGSRVIALRGRAAAQSRAVSAQRRGAAAPGRGAAAPSRRAATQGRDTAAKGHKATGVPGKTRTRKIRRISDRSRGEPST